MASTKGVHIISLDEEYNIIENHKSYMTDKDIRCMAKVGLNTFIFAMKRTADLFVVKRN